MHLVPVADSKRNHRSTSIWVEQAVRFFPPFRQNLEYSQSHAGSLDEEQHADEENAMELVERAQITYIHSVVRNL